jgi:hypothetical protein
VRHGFMKGGGKARGAGAPIVSEHVSIQTHISSRAEVGIHTVRFTSLLSIIILESDVLRKRRKRLNTSAQRKSVWVASTKLSSACSSLSSRAGTRITLRRRARSALSTHGYPVQKSNAPNVLAPGLEIPKDPMLILLGLSHHPVIK